MLCISVGIGQAVQAGPTLYAVDGRDDVMFTTSIADACTLLIGSTNENNITNMTFLGDRLLGYEGQKGLCEIDDATGAATQTGGVPSGLNVGDAMANDSSSGVLYAMLGMASGQGSNHLVPSIQILAIY